MTYSAICPICHTAIVIKVDFDTATNRKNFHNTVKHDNLPYSGPAYVVEDK